MAAVCVCSQKEKAHAEDGRSNLWGNRPNRHSNTQKKNSAFGEDFSKKNFLTPQKYYNVV